MSYDVHGGTPRGRSWALVVVALATIHAELLSFVFLTPHMVASLHYTQYRAISVLIIQMGWLLAMISVWRCVRLRIPRANITHCAVCEYIVRHDQTNSRSNSSMICPECGADLTKPGAVVRGRRMSPEAASRLWWIVGVAWFLTTAVWIARWIW